MDRLRYLLGLVTLVAAAIGGLYLMRLLGDEDRSGYFRVSVEFRDVGGLMPGADVRYRGVIVGSVRQVKLRDDGRKGIAVLDLAPGKEVLARTNTRFWIVTPRFGLTSGASGLETLVRDAYIAFLTPSSPGPQLSPGASLLGVELPYSDPSESQLDAVRRGDLLMELLVAENFGLKEGSSVRFRGMKAGEVRHAELAKDGSHVRVRLRIARRFRQIVTDKTCFWVARPRLSGHIVSGISIEDLGALLGPYVGFYTEDGEGLPVPDGYVIAAETERPDITVEKITITDVEQPTDAAEPEVENAVQTVMIIYEAVEEDVFSANDVIRRESTGVLFEDQEGRLLVLTARTACDASYFVTDGWSEPDIISEGISVVLRNGDVLRGLRTWVADDGVDLALLVVENAGAQRDRILATPAELFDFDASELDPAGLQLRVADRNRGFVDGPAGADGELPALASHRGGVALAAGRVVGLLGQAGGHDETPAVRAIQPIPEALRPAK